MSLIYIKNKNMSFLNLILQYFMSLCHLNKYMIFHKYFLMPYLLIHELKLFEYPLHLTYI